MIKSKTVADSRLPVIYTENLEEFADISPEDELDEDDAIVYNLKLLLINNVMVWIKNNLLTLKYSK